MSFTWDDGFHERDTAYYAAVGYLCHQWNNVEHFVYGMASDIMQVERKYHGILFRHLSIKSLQEFLEDYASERLPAATLEAVKFANAYVERCRVNRNVIIHGTPSSDPYTGTPIIRTRADKNRRIAKNYPISLEEIRRVCDDCDTAGWLLIRLQFLVLPEDKKAALQKAGFGAPALPERPPLPELLAGNPHTPPAL